jgi:hypothetical protein
MEIITRQKAIARGFKRYFTGVPCKHGHVCERTVSASHCYECERERQQRMPGRQEYKAAHYEANKDVRLTRQAAYAQTPRGKAVARGNVLKSTFAITVAFYDFLHALQGGVCMHCKKSESRRGKDGSVNTLCVEHSHDAPYEVRGLACFNCNTSMGKLGDTPEHLRAAARALAGDTVPHPLQRLLAAAPVPRPDLSIPTDAPARRLVWNLKPGPGEVSSFDVLTRLEALRDGG